MLKYFIAGVVFAAWAGLFFTQNAVIVYWETTENNMGIPKLNCTYFTGISLLEKSYVKTDMGMVGRETCANFVSTAE